MKCSGTTKLNSEMILKISSLENSQSCCTTRYVCVIRGTVGDVLNWQYLWKRSKGPCLWHLQKLAKTKLKTTTTIYVLLWCYMNYKPVFIPMLHSTYIVIYFSQVFYGRWKSQTLWDGSSHGDTGGEVHIGAVGWRVPQWEGRLYQPGG